MALSALEQIKIVNGEVSPSQTDLRTLVKQSGYIFGTSFQQNYKEIPQSAPLTEAETLANSYITKMMNLVRTSLRSTNADDSLYRVMISLIGESNVTFEQVQQATDLQWEAFVQDQSDEAFEIFADIRRDEKTAYNSF